MNVTNKSTKYKIFIENKLLLAHEYQDGAFQYDTPRKIYKMTNSYDDLLRTWN